MIKYKDLCRITDELIYRSLLKTEQIDLIKDLYDEEVRENIDYHADFFSKNKEAEDVIKIYGLQKDRFAILGQVCKERLNYLDKLIEALNQGDGVHEQTLREVVQTLVNYLDPVYNQYAEKEKLFRKLVGKFSGSPDKNIWKDISDIKMTDEQLDATYKDFDQAFIRHQICFEEADQLKPGDSDPTKGA